MVLTDASSLPPSLPPSLPSYPWSSGFPFLPVLSGSVRFGFTCWVLGPPKTEELQEARAGTVCVLLHDVKQEVTVQWSSLANLMTW